MGLNQRTDNRADDAQGTGGLPAPRHGRAALLRLATWFEEAGPDRAHALAAAAYALHPALHLEGRVDEGVAATTSWWQADPDRSTVIERPGSRLPEPVRDHRAQQARLRDAAESSAHWRRAGAAQIRALLTEPTGHRARLDLSGAGMEVLMELLTAALGSGDASRRPTSAGDLEFSLRLHVITAPGAEVTVQGEGGELTLEGLRLCVTDYDQHVVEEAAESTGGAEDGSPDEAPEESAPEGGTPGGEVPDASGTFAAEEASPAAAPRDPLTDPLPPEALEDPEAPPARAYPAGQDDSGPDAGEADTEGSPQTPAEDTEPTGNLHGPDPDVETTGPLDLSANRSWTRSWG
ncbi:hypothetical protein A6A08_00735 [Nocardiopsis sp. TSRI0078]|uniref:DUF2397 family protein n=1 Tax=unclassified Nocardiopsis TaxID=2649073 RepID=UPI00094023C3|nr:DUF2397 family protein [Nocardiopsis sp. TSRI0078]OKI23364.1 hypothetical protein A6A08_00735 [Nocardiopsis sp. TSRI0078]